MHLQVCATVFTVYIGVNIWCQHSMVQCSVKGYLLVRRAAADGYFAEFFVPGSCSSIFYFVEIPVRQFCIQIEFGILRTNAGDTDFYLYGFIPGNSESEIGFDIFPIN